MKEIVARGQKKEREDANEWMEGRKRMERNRDKDGNVSNSRVGG
jgi:hypothetical protein